MQPRSNLSVQTWRMALGVNIAFDIRELNGMHKRTNHTLGPKVVVGLAKRVTEFADAAHLQHSSKLELPAREGVGRLAAWNSNSQCARERVQRLRHLSVSCLGHATNAATLIPDR